MKPSEILQHLSQNSRALQSVIAETYYNPDKHKFDTLAFTTKYTVFEDFITNHLAGKKRVGFRDTNKLGKSNWFALDFDHPDNHTKKGLPDYYSVLNEVKRTAFTLGLKYLEVKSRSGKGIHLWFLFDDYVYVTRLRDVIGAMVPTEFINKGIDIFPYEQTGLPAAIYAPFYNCADLQADYDCLNSANLVEVIADKFLGSYKHKSKTKKTPSTASMKQPQNGATIPLATQTTNVEAERLPVNYGFNKPNQTVVEVNGKKHSGYSNSEVSKSYSTIVNSHRGLKNIIRKLVSRPVFNTTDYYLQQFKLARKLNLTSFKTISEFNRYFESMDDKYEAGKGTWKNASKKKNYQLVSAFTKRDCLVVARRDQCIALNCADVKDRSDCSVFPVYTTVELVHKKEALVHVLMRDLLGTKGARYIGYTLPIYNEQFIQRIQSGWKIYLMKAVERKTKNKQQEKRYDIQISIKPTTSNQKPQTITVSNYSQHSGQVKTVEPETKGLGLPAYLMDDGQQERMMTNDEHVAGAQVKVTFPIGNNLGKPKLAKCGQYLLATNAGIGFHN